MRSRRTRPARRRRARPRAASAASCSTRPTPGPWPGGGCRRCRRARAGGRRPRARCRSRRGWCPATSETITRSRPRKAFTSEDLPTFGRPMTASRTRSSSSAVDRLVGRKQLDEPVEQVAGAEALRGRDGHRVAEPEPVEVVREREVARRVDLVRDEHDGHVAAAQEVGDLLVARPHAGTRVDDEHRDLRVGQRGARLVLDRDGERVLVVEVHAAGVDQRERAPVPVGLELLAVARDARALVHDRLARLGEAVHQRRLAHVGVADDGDLHASISLASTTSVKIISSTASRSSWVVSTGTASLAAISGECARRSSRSSRSSCAVQRRLEVGAELLRAAAGALLGRGGQEDLDRRVRADDGADVAALGDPVAVLRGSPAACARAPSARRCRR